jgi:hypothetical protein
MSPIAVQFDGGAPVLDVERRRLACGLEVVLHREPTALNVAVHVHYRVGSSDEAPGRTGVAHLFEHLFKNSAHLAGQNHYELLREVGGSGNASTGSDATNYHAVVPPDALALALWIESDRMGYLLPGLDEVRLAKQIDVVRAERRQRYENAAYGRERFATAEALYPEGHPHRHLTIGTHADIAATTLAELQAWYRTWYVPANAVLAIAGAIDLDEAWTLVERYFGSFPVSARPPRANPAPAAPRATELVVDDPRAALARVRHAWLGPPRGHEDEWSLAVLADVLPRAGEDRNRNRNRNRPKPKPRPRPKPKPSRVGRTRQTPMKAARPPAAGGQAPGEAADPVDLGEGADDVGAADVAPGDGDLQRGGDLGGAAVRHAHVVAPHPAGAAAALGDVERDAARGAPQLIDQLGVVPRQPRAQRRQRANQFERQIEGDKAHGEVLSVRGCPEPRRRRATG